MPRAIAVILFAIISVSSLFVITGFSSEPTTTASAPSSTSSEAISIADTPIDPIERKPGYTALYREIFDRLATRHYRGQKIDDELSQRYLAQFLDNLDPVKSYFLQTDIDEFMQWDTRLDDLAKRGDVEPGYTMFNRLRDRAISQLNANIALLQDCFLYTSPSPRDRTRPRMPSSA